MGDCQNKELRVNFDRTLKVEFLGSKATTDAGLVVYRELDQASGNKIRLNQLCGRGVEHQDGL